MLICCTSTLSFSLFLIQNLFASFNNVFLICIDCLQDVQRAVTLKGRARSSEQRREILTAENKEHFMSQIHLQPKIRDTIKYCQDVIKNPAKLKKPKKKSSTKARKRFICHQCKKNLSSNLGLSNHIENIHNKSTRFFCDYCDKRFWLKSTMARHVKTHVKPAAARESLTSPIWKCWKRLCGEVFNNPKELNNHYFNHYNTSRYLINHDLSSSQETSSI